MTLSVDRITLVSASTEEEPTATLDEWNAIPRIPGWRFIDGWWHDSKGGRTNTPPAPVTERQLKILAGIIPIH